MKTTYYITPRFGRDRNRRLIVDMFYRPREEAPASTLASAPSRPGHDGARLERRARARPR